MPQTSYEKLIPTFLFQCVWPLATHTADQIYGIHDPLPKKERIAQNVTPSKDISDSSNNIQEKNDTKRQDCFGEQRISAELNVTSPVPISDSPVFDSPEKPQFLRPTTGGMTPQKGSVGRDICDGRITPPPPMISPLPATPAGSMTPVCNTYI